MPSCRSGISRARAFWRAASHVLRPPARRLPQGSFIAACLAALAKVGLRTRDSRPPKRSGPRARRRPPEPPPRSSRNLAAGLSRFDLSKCGACPHPEAVGPGPAFWRAASHVLRPPARRLPQGSFIAACLAALAKVGLRTRDSRPPKRSGPRARRGPPEPPPRSSRNLAAGLSRFDLSKCGSCPHGEAVGPGPALASGVGCSFGLTRRGRVGELES